LANFCQLFADYQLVEWEPVKNNGFKMPLIIIIIKFIEENRSDKIQKEEKVTLNYITDK